MRLSELQKIIKILEESNIEEIEIKGIFRKVRISKKKAQSSISSQSSSTSEIVSAQGGSASGGKDNIPSSERDIARNVPTPDVIAIKAPMVGTCYRAPASDAPPYVEIGDKIHKGKILCIIEAMKVMNEIESDIDGVVEKVLVKNEDPVEYGQELFLVKPAA